MPKKELAKGYTTGTCAQAATRAAMQMLFTGEKVEQVSVELPQGEKLQLDITDIQRKYTDRELPDMVSCAVTCIFYRQFKWCLLCNCIISHLRLETSHFDRNRFMYCFMLLRQNVG